MKIVTKIWLGFGVILLLVMFQNVFTYKGVKSIGGEVTEIAEYQIPIDSVLTEVEKDVLEEKSIFYEMLLADKEQFSKLKDRFKKIEEATDKNCDSIYKLVHKAVNVSEEEHIKNEYKNIIKIVDNVCKEQKHFEELVAKVEKEIKYKNIKLKENEKLVEHLIEKMDIEMSKSEDSLVKLLEESTTNAENDEHHLILLIIILIIVMTLLIGAVGYFISNNIKTAINNIAQGINSITNNQDLTIRLDENRTDEFGEIGKNINNLLNNLKQLIDDSKNSSAENAAISHELSTTSLNVGRNVENSVSIVDDATKQALSIQENINETIVIAQKSKDEICDANKHLSDAQNDVLDLTDQVQNSAVLENELAERMATLSSNANDVKAILEVISDIADQTNLLALNAAIEAARAGEHGRGFAVVADEVRKLAERTQSSLTEINSTINVIVQSILETSEQMGQNSKVVKSLSDKALSVKEKMDITTEIVDNTTQTIDKMVIEFDLTTKHIKKITNDISQINDISAKNARNVEEIAAAAEHLNSMTDKLNVKLAIFKT